MNTQKFSGPCGEALPLRTFGKRHKTVAEKRSMSGSPKTMLPKEVCLLCEADAERKELHSDSEKRQKDRLKVEIQTKKRKITEKKAKTRQRQQITRVQAARDELVARELARRSLLGFTKRFSPNYLAGWVHVDICNRLERFNKAVERRENPRLIDRKSVV